MELLLELRQENHILFFAIILLHLFWNQKAQQRRTSLLRMCGSGAENASKEMESENIFTVIGDSVLMELANL